MSFKVAYPKVERSQNDYRPRNVGLCKRVCRTIRYHCSSSKLNKRSAFVSEHVTKVPVDFRAQLFNQLRAIPMTPMSEQHTHGEAASLRTSVSKRFETVIKDAGYTPYNVSMSARDKHAGYTPYHIPKDLMMTYKEDKIGDKHVLVFIDNDYYEDMNAWLSFGNPILIYTFVPTTAGGEIPEGNANFSIKDDVITYNVSGGATYRHPIWDYTGSHASAIRKDGTLVTYAVEQHTLEADPTRRIICLCPIYHVPYPYYKFLQECGPLKRKTYLTNGVNAVEDHTAQTYSLADNGSDISVTVPKRLYAALLERFENSSKPMISDLERLMAQGPHKMPNAAIDAAILFKLMRKIQPAVTASTSGLDCNKVNYQAAGPLATEDGKPSGRQTTPSLVTQGNVFPCRSHNNDRASIEGRVLRTSNGKVPPQKYILWAEEFANLLVKDPNVGLPISHSEVVERQNRPSQRNRSKLVENTITGEYMNKLRTFIKAEPSNGTNDPRNITTVSTEHTIAASAFTYPFKEDILRNMKWYSPGKRPVVLAERVGCIVQPNGSIARDYSRFDGTISEWLQKNVVQRCYLRWCSHSVKAQMRKIFEEDHVQRATTSTGFKYNPGFGTKSGSPFTTDGNTIINAFNAYCALRMIGHSILQAWDNLGLYCGDDGIDQNLPGLSEAMDTVAIDLGLQLKKEIFDIAEPVAFCGRVFVAPAAMTDSYAIPMRTVSKLHLSPMNASISREQAATNKALGYITTDAQTPIIAAWAETVLRITGLNAKNLTHEEDYKIENGAWPQTNPQAIRESFSALFGYSISEISDIELAIRSATTLDSIPQGILDNGDSVEHKLRAVLGDEIVGPMPTSIPKCQQTPENSAKASQSGNAPQPNISKEPSPSTSPNMTATATKESKAQSLPKQKSTNLPKPSPTSLKSNPSRNRRRKRNNNASTQPQTTSTPPKPTASTTKTDGPKDSPKAGPSDSSC